jgi:hypothetical protein
MFNNITDFTADKFTPTTWQDAKAKARFGKTFIKFVEADFPRRLFSKAFYHRLAMCFGHLAHYDVFEFYDTFFTSTAGKVRFLRMTLQWACYGDPSFTYSDVERAIQSWLVQSGVVEKYEKRLEEEKEAAERKELDRLKNKYEASPVQQ